MQIVFSILNKAIYNKPSVLILFVSLLQTSIIYSQRWKTIKPITDTSFVSELLVYHAEYTGSQDIETDSGQLRVPDSLKAKIYNQIPMDIGKKEFKILFGKPPKWKKSEYMYLIRGRVSYVTDRGFKDKAGVRYIPFFEIYQYKRYSKKWLFNDNTE